MGSDQAEAGAEAETGPALTEMAQIEHFRMIQVISMLRIEVNTGMKHSRGSVLKIAQSEFNCKSRTKQGALDELLAKYQATYGKEYGKP